MRDLNVSHRLGSYLISFQPLATAIRSLPENSFCITDENVSHFYGDRLDADRTIVLPPGERTKSISSFEKCLEWLAERGADRASSLVAFGGGVVGDLGGFVASSYMRGIPYVQIPSTLLAQVDSAVGGKVGVDLAAGKNLAGSFYPPSQVFVCLELLDTLDRRNFNNGMAEVWKYGFIADASFVGGLASGLAGTPNGLEEIVVRCLEIKGDIVSTDELETIGLRAILNFGHTVGHAIEAITCYSSLLHGEAISIGMCTEAKLGERMGLTESGTAKQVRDCLLAQGLPTDLDAGWDPPALIEPMLRDKKRLGTGLAFSLLTTIGQCKLIRNVPVRDVELVLRER